MAEPRTCPKCGAALAADAAEGSCPRCLLAAGLESGEGGAKGPPSAPPPEEMAKHFPSLEILEVLGQGGMGIVYKARQKTLDRIVALKVLPPEAAREQGFSERFTREARTLARLQHANIVHVYDFGESDGLFYLVMEYVDGANLREAMRAGRLTPAQALAVVPQVCSALQFAHDQGVVHRDVKPENILLDRQGRVKIADFGLAKIVQRSPVDLTITRAGQVMGTVHYMAPEQYRTPDAVDHRADIYSLGVVIYEMLTGELPLGSFPPPSEKSTVDARVDGVVLRALERERDRRWQHASEVGDRITAISSSVAADAAAAAAAGSPGSAPAPAAGAPAAEAAPPAAPRVFERLALYGALGLPAALVAGVILGHLARLVGLGDHARGVGFTVYMLVGLAGWGCSIAAWARIHHSGGRLAGKPWAIVGTLLNPLVLCCPGSLLLAVLGPSHRIHMGRDGMDFGGIVIDDKGIHGPGFSIDDKGIRAPGVEIDDNGIRAPGVTIDDRGVRAPGVNIRDTPDFTQVEIPGVRLTDGKDAPPDDAAEAALVHGGPEPRDERTLAAIARGVRQCWTDRAAMLFERTFPLYVGRDRTMECRFPGRAADYRLYAVALDPDGKSGRAVVTDGNYAISVTIERSGDTWSLGDMDWEWKNGPATKDDEDGRLFR